MALQDYTLGEMRSEVLAEFGLDENNDVDLVNRAINRAQMFILQERPNWPFLRKPFTLDIQPAVTGSGQFFLGSRGFSGDLSAAGTRFVLNPASQNGDLYDGYLIVRPASADSDRGTLDGQFLAGTTAGSTYPITSARAYYQLPDDCMEVRKLHTSDLKTRIPYAPPDTFEKIRRRHGVVPLGRPYVYTVTPDPIATLPGLWLSVFPVPVERQTLRGEYDRHVPTLESVNDVPVLPREYRPVLVEFANWFVARKRGGLDPAETAEYQATAMRGLEKLLQRYEFVTDEDRVTDLHMRRTARNPFSDLDLPIRDN